MRATLREIAEKAGVSPQTVSNVLNHRPGRVSQETRQRVLAAVEELNYIPIPRPAMQNRHVETHAIGVAYMGDQKFLEDFREQLGLHTFAGIRDRAGQHEYDLLILSPSRPEASETSKEARFLDRRYDGIIFVGQCPRSWLEKLVQHQMPTVVCYSPDAPPGIATVLVDNAAAMRLAADTLLQQGHRRIAHLAGPHWSQEAAERRDHYRDAMLERGHPLCAARIVQGETWGNNLPQSRPDCEAILDAVVKRGVTGVVCANDFLALDLLHVAKERGIHIPENVSLIGMDNLEEGAQQGLSSIVNPSYQIGSQAVDAVLCLLQGGDYQQASRRVPVELVSRHSVAAPEGVAMANALANSGKG